jgi:hypothetical protein
MKIFEKLKKVKERSRRKGLRFNLTEEWLLTKLDKGRCEATGLPFKFDKDPYINPYYPTIDRINSDKGYTVDNCQLVCWMFNNAKGEADEKIFAHWAKHYVRMYDKTML